MNRPIIAHIRPEDYHAALLRIIADASAITQEIEVRLPDGSAQTYKIGDTLDGGDVLPGLAIDLSKVFEDAV